MKRILLMSGLAVTSLAAWSVPQLKTQAELIADGELKAKVLAGSRGVPPPTPQARRYIVTRGGESREVKWYAAADLWRLRAFAGEWKDKKGNVLRLARVRGLVPEIERGEGERDAVEEAIVAAEKDFTGSAEQLAAWQSAWGGKGRFCTVRDRRYYYEFAFAETVKPAEAEKLGKAFEKSLSAMTAGLGGAVSSMRWWELENAQYTFLSDLDKAKGGKFVKDAMRLMEAMRKGYEFYVPQQKPVGKGTVRVFKTLAGYREYRASTGAQDQMSCGLWDPSREELLIAAESPDQAQNTMRHEAFHQYLFHATGNGNHAMWFNEGHACFFENVKYNPAKNTIRVMEDGVRAAWVAKNAERCARSIATVVKLPHDEFYAGEVNLHYCTAWAIVYFLEKGAYTSEAFAPYRGICPKYLELTAQGQSAADATAQAWALVADRDVAADFLKFWREKRKAAVGQRL